jgi:purine-binding chemotaxis protein CheW
MRQTPSSSSQQADTDWEDLRRRLANSDRAIDALINPDRRQQAQILGQRVADLAQVSLHPPRADASDEVLEVLVFESAGERYALEASRVAQVCPMSPVTVIPGVPGFVVGIVPHHGNVLSVIDLRSLLNLPLSRLADPAAIIVLESETMAFGILAESIVGVERYTLASLQQAWPALANIEKTYLKGVAPDRTAILDAERLLSDPRLIVDAA